MKRYWALAAGFVAIVAAAPALVPIEFEELGERAGLLFSTHSSITMNRNQPETMVAGVAFVDYDNDGRQDLYFVNGAEIPSLQKTGTQYWNRLFHNNGDGTFTDVTEKAGVRGEGYGMGVAVGDFDNDGWPDLFLANVTANQLYRNNHDGTFTDVTAKARLSGAVQAGRKMWAVSAGWFDYNNDGRLDLFISNYCVWEVNKDPFCGPNPSTRAYCHPKNYAPLPNTLYRNNGDGTFTDVSKETGIAASLGKGMGVVFADYDHDGWMDVFVADDNAPNQLFHNLKGVKFEEVALQSGVAYPESGAFISGMGADFKDIDNDGWEDLWHTAIEGETFPLFRNLGKNGEFEERTGVSGLAHLTRDMAGWSSGVFDFDNDGWKDLFVVRGNVQDDKIAALTMRKADEPMSLFRNLGNGKFEEALKGKLAARWRRGAALGDLDNDGRIDIVTTTLDGRAEYFHNTTRGGHWLLVELTGTKSNRMGLGTRIKVTTADGKTYWNHATTSTGYAASSDARVHFGLGGAGQIKELELLWPSGTKQVLRDLAADRILKIREP